MTERETEEIIRRVLEKLQLRKENSGCLLEELSVEGMMEVSLGLAICPEAKQVMEVLQMGKPVRIGSLEYRRYQDAPKVLLRLWEEGERRICRMGVTVGEGNGGRPNGNRPLITLQRAEELAARGEKPPQGAILTPLAADVWKVR